MHAWLRREELAKTLAAAAACLLLACPALAEQGWLREIRGGPLWHDVDGLWSDERVERGIDWNAELLLWKKGLVLPFGLGSLHPNLGASVNDAGDTSKVYAGVLLDLETPFGLFLDLGIGGAWHDGARETRDPDRKELGSRLLFRIPIELGYAFTEHHRLMVSFDHVSNAGLASPNEGLDTLGVRYGYRF
jgi:hypothetical protein